jgi:hypothetical protein
MKIRVLRSNQGGEYKSNEFNEYRQKEGIKRELTTSHTPQQVGVSERKNKTLIEAIVYYQKCKTTRSVLERSIVYN